MEEIKELVNSIKPFCYTEWADVKALNEGDGDAHEHYHYLQKEKSVVKKGLKEIENLLLDENTKGMVNQVLTEITDDFMKNAEHLTSLGGELDCFFEYLWEKEGDILFKWEPASALERFKVMFKWNEWIFQHGYDMHAEFYNSNDSFLVFTISYLRKQMRNTQEAVGLLLELLILMDILDQNIWT
jgi:hypothetical protein